MGYILRNNDDIECFPHWKYADVKALHKHFEIGHGDEERKHRYTIRKVTRPDCKECQRLKAVGEANARG